MTDAEIAERDSMIADEVEALLRARLDRRTADGFSSSMTVLGLVTARMIHDSGATGFMQNVAVTMAARHIEMWLADPEGMRPQATNFQPKRNI